MRRRYSFLILLKINTEKHRIVMPVPLALAEEVVGAATLIAKIFLYIYPNLVKKYMPDKIPSFNPKTVRKLLDLPVVILGELRRTGPLTLVRVNDGGEGVEIRLI